MKAKHNRLFGWWGLKDMAERKPKTRTKPDVRRVVMAKLVARRWLQANGKAEYRFDVLYGAREIKYLPSLLRSFRDGKVAMTGGLKAIPDLGIKEGFDSLSVWSGDRVALIGLKDWFETRGFETTGVW